MRNWILFALLISGACISCQRSRPARKKLPPELTSFSDVPPQLVPVKAPSDILFYYSDTALLIQGLRRNLAVITLADPEKDSTIRSLVTAGQSLTSFLVAELHRDNKTGLVIDLRQDEYSPTIRQDYLVEPTGQEKLPVIFLWDKSSAARAAMFTQLFEQFPGITWSITSGQPRYQQDCFKDIHPNF
jgi:hypothetical protein